MADHYRRQPKFNFSCAFGEKRKASIKNLAVIDLDERPREILALSAVLHWTQSVQRRKLSNCRFPMSARFAMGKGLYVMGDFAE